MDQSLKPDFSIIIDYEKQSENPSRIFEAMSALIKAFQEFDKDLIKVIDNKIEPVLLLEDIEIGSLKTWFVNLLRGVPDEAIKDLDWKGVVGHYLVKAKYIMIKKLEGKTVITDAKFIEDIQFEIVEEARKTDVKLMPSYTPPTLPALIRNIDKINTAVKSLSKNDSAIMKSQYGEATFNLELNISPNELEDLVTKEKVTNETVMILKVKKPDYLGSSMWELKHGSRTIDAKMSDAKWLNEFHERKVDIRPGDSIRAMVKTEVKYGFSYEVIAFSYDVIEVREIIQGIAGNQTDIDFDNFF